MKDIYSNNINDGQHGTHLGCSHPFVYLSYHSSSPIGPCFIFRHQYMSDRTKKLQRGVLEFGNEWHDQIVISV